MLVIEGELAPVIERRWQARRVTRKEGATVLAEHVFHRDGHRIHNDARAWRTACKAAGLRAGRRAGGKTPHDFRRTAARNLIRAGVSEGVAMSVTGHKTRSMFDRYNITSEADLRTAMQRVSAHFQAQPTAATVIPLAQVTGR